MAVVVVVVTRVSEFSVVETAVRSVAILSPLLVTVASSSVDPECVESVGYACAFVAVFAVA